MTKKNKGLPPGITRKKINNKNYYRVRSKTDKAGHRLETVVKTLDKAVEKIKEYENLIKSDISLKSNKTPITLVFTSYMNEPYQKSLTYSWRNQKLTNFKKNILGYFGNAPLNKFNNNSCNDYINWLINKKSKNGKNYSTSTIKQNKELLISILKHAQEKKSISHVPTLKIPKPKKVYTRDRILKDDLKLFFNELKNERLEPAILLICFTGIRASECTGLTWGDYDKKTNTFNIDSQIATTQDGTRAPRHVKNHRTRKIPIVNEIIIKALDTWAIKQLKEFEKMDIKLNTNNHIFTKENGQYYKYPSTILHTIKRVCKNAGIRNIVTHELRHNLASNLIEVSNPEYVKYVMGHKSIRTTYDFYVHPAQDKIKKELKKLEILD